VKRKSLIMLIGVAVVLSAGVSAYWSSHYARFTTQGWRRGETSRSDARKAMVRDLLAAHSPLGKTPAEVDALLGPPSQRAFSGYDRVYWLGREDSLMPIDSTWLGLKFRNGVVVEASQFTD
jgi:hypothetical protein